MMQVKLTQSESFLAAIVASQRVVENIFLGRANKHGEEGWGWTRHIEGAAAELAVAKNLDMFWSGNVGDIRADDVGKFQVRQTEYSSGSLLLHKEDPDEKIFILVTGLIPNFVLRGWLRAGEGKKEGYWKERVEKRPAYFVPQAVLHDMSSLKKELEALRLPVAW